MKLIELITSGEPACWYKDVFVGTYFKKWKFSDGNPKRMVFDLNIDKIEYLQPVTYSVYDFKLRKEKLSFLDRLVGITPNNELEKKTELERVNLTCIKTTSGNRYYVDQTIDEIKKLIEG